MLFETYWQAVLTLHERLGYQTPTETLWHKALRFKCKSTLPFSRE